MLSPVVRRTLWPRGVTPILPVAAKRDRISAISCITLSPRRYGRGSREDNHRAWYFDTVAIHVEFGTQGVCNQNLWIAIPSETGFDRLRRWLRL